MAQKSHRKPRGKVASQIGKPVRAALAKFLREHVRTQEEKEKLAKFLDVSLATVELMIYQGGGSLDSWLGILKFLQIEPTKVASALGDLSSTFRKVKKTRESDRLWFALDDLLTEEEKCGWAILIRASAALELRLRKSKK